VKAPGAPGDQRLRPASTPLPRAAPRIQDDFSAPGGSRQRRRVPGIRAAERFNNVPGGRCEPAAVLRGPQLHGLRADTIPGAAGLAANPVQVAAGASPRSAVPQYVAGEFHLAEVLGDLFEHVQ
jgi:hypothetical protein